MRSAVFALVLLACSKSSPEPERTPPPPAPPEPVVKPAPSAAPSSDLAWEAPAGWTSAPNASPMRKATYKIPKVAGDPEDAELTVTAASGGVEANVKRWSGQFGDAAPKTETRKVNGLPVTIVEIKGTFASGGMMGAPSTPKEKFMLLGAVVESGPQQHFFKMTGPEKTVVSARKDFDALVSSFRAK
jgi:hypothetical protein